MLLGMRQRNLAGHNRLLAGSEASMMLVTPAPASGLATLNGPLGPLPCIALCWRLSGYVSTATGCNCIASANATGVTKYAKLNYRD
jgi:hypothetical protein